MFSCQLPTSVAEEKAKNVQPFTERLMTALIFSHTKAQTLSGQLKWFTV